MKNIGLIGIVLGLIFMAAIAAGQSRQVDTTKPYHPLQQIAKSSSDLTSVDADSNGVIDAADTVLGYCAQIYGTGTIPVPVPQPISGSQYLVQLAGPTWCLDKDCYIVFTTTGTTQQITDVVELIQMSTAQTGEPWYSYQWPSVTGVNILTSSGSSRGTNGDTSGVQIAAGTDRSTQGVQFTLYDDYSSGVTETNKYSWSLYIATAQTISANIYVCG